MDYWVFVTFVVTFLAGILSGIGGGGAGFITMPYYVLIGLSPTHALATSKLGSLGNSFGAFTAFQGTGFVHKRLVIPFTLITIVCAFASAWLLPQMDPIFFQKTVGIMLVILVPTLFINRAALQPGARSTSWTSAGFLAYTIFSFIQTLFGTGIGSILVLILMFLFGLTTLEASATKRVAQSAQALILFVLLGYQGFVVWAHGLSALIGSSIGTHIGTNMALKKGDRFVKIMLAATMFASGIILLWDS